MQSGVSQSRSTLPVPMHRHANLCRTRRKCGNVKGNETTYLARGAGDGAVSGAGAVDKDESVCQVVPSRVDRLKDRQTDRPHCQTVSQLAEQTKQQLRAERSTLSSHES